MNVLIPCLMTVFCLSTVTDSSSRTCTEDGLLLSLSLPRHSMELVVISEE